MGKRKERRLAAKTASNRRVKLDLLAEPSGEFGDSSTKEEAGIGSNAINHEGSLDSPSSSGQKPENPLLLLGQYSDEEAEEESGKDTNRDTEENSPAELEEQVKVDIPEGEGADKDENFTTEKVDQENNNQSSSLDVLRKLAENGAVENHSVVTPHIETDSVEQASVPYTSDSVTTSDVDSGWKMVLHEESNTYYYWNIVTGETSWEVPIVLHQGNEPATEVEEKHVTSVDNHMANATLDAEMDASNGSTSTMVFEAKETNSLMPELEKHDGKQTNIVADDNTIDDKTTSNVEGVNYGFSNNSLSNGEAHHVNSSIQLQDMNGYGNKEAIGDFSSDSYRLLQLGESLSERLKSLKGSEGFNDQITKLKFELDIRLADIKSLVPYGSSLLPFWLHSENQLKNLEASINNEVLKCSQSANIGEMINDSVSKLQENTSEATENEKKTTTTATTTSMELNASDDNNIIKETVEEDKLQNLGFNSVEDEDMDVEMEVEDELRVVENESRGCEEESDIPPPPNDEWIPPPPPDDEPLPPPPPDEPPETSFLPPPGTQATQQAYTYGEQYNNYAYAGTSYDYYGQIQANTEVPNHEYYVDANGVQVAPTLYYAPYPDGATPAVNHVEQPVTYYTLQEGIAPVIGSSVEASVLQKSAPKSIDKDTGKPSTEVTTAATTIASTESVPKAQPKVARNKKRTVATVPGLRSNKKVSGLVDKWKAVKEELHEDEEDEPENAYEVLEKKRQREIEQWIAQQIATGEAKDNANFQPLGGDWRERVRRKRAKKSVEAEENEKGVDDTKQKPDLVQLTKQLPSGWQAYWDEASKQVYYANSKTSETTWIKPTN